LHQQGLSQREINKQTGYSRCGIQAVIKKFEESGEVKDKKRTGRPRKLSNSDEKFLIVSSLRDQRSLIRNGLHGRVAAKIFADGEQGEKAKIC